MAEIVQITEEEKELITPHLKEHLDPDSWDMINYLFSFGVVHTYPEGMHYITVNVPGFPAMQFNAENGEFTELTTWEYVQTVDTDAQLEEFEKEELIETITLALKHYHKTEFQIMTDYTKVILNRTELTVNNQTIYKYECPAQPIYLTEDNYPITYDKQKVDAEYYYYIFENNLGSYGDTDDVTQYTFRVPYEWKRNSIWG